MGVSDDLRIVSAGAMPPDPLREKLKALVEDLRPPLDPDEAKNDRYWLGWNDCLDTLLREDALLAESDPEPLVAMVDRLQGILNRVQQALAKYAGDDAYRVPQESLPLLIVSLLTSKAALLPSAAVAARPTVVPGGSKTGHSFTPPESEPEPCSAAACTSTEHHSTDCPARRPDCEAEAKLPLGHEWQGILGLAGTTGPCTYRIDEQRGFRDCGQPRSAHEPK